MMLLRTETLVYLNKTHLNPIKMKLKKYFYCWYCDDITPQKRDKFNKCYTCRNCGTNTFDNYELKPKLQAVIVLIISVISIMALMYIFL